MNQVYCLSKALVISTIWNEKGKPDTRQQVCFIRMTKDIQKLTASEVKIFSTVEKKDSFLEFVGDFLSGLFYFLKGGWKRHSEL